MGHLSGGHSQIRVHCWVRSAPSCWVLELPSIHPSSGFLPAVSIRGYAGEGLSRENGRSKTSCCADPPACLCSFLHSPPASPPPISQVLGSTYLCAWGALSSFQSHHQGVLQAAGRRKLFGGLELSDRPGETLEQGHLLSVHMGSQPTCASSVG